MGENSLLSAAKIGDPSAASDGRLSPKCVLAAGMHTRTDPKSRDVLAGVLAGVESPRVWVVARVVGWCVWCVSDGADESPRKREGLELRLKEGGGGGWGNIKMK